MALTCPPGVGGHVPECRRADLSECGGRAALIERGLGACWQGPPRSFCDGPIEVDVVADDTGALFLTPIGTQLTPVTAAGLLAEASGFARYTEEHTGGRGWGKVLANEVDCDLAYDKAKARRSVPVESLDAWRQLILAHQVKFAAASCT